MKPFVIIDNTYKERRLTLAFILALIVHAALILGVRFTVLPPRSQEPVLSLNVTLLEHAGGEPGAAAGALPEPEPEPEPSTPLLDEPALSQPMTLSPVNVQPSEPLPAQRLAPVAAAPTPNPAKAALPRPEKLTPPKPASTPEPPLAAAAPSTPPISNRAAAAPVAQTASPALSAIDLMNRGIQMARLDSAKPEANGSREKRIDQESTTTLEKFYMQAWERKVEQVGTLNFPEEARRLNLTTGPVLDVAIRADGGVHSITLVRSSGHPELDKAARRIIELAAPYAAFPPELRRQYDVLHIVRKWRFEQGRLLQK